MWIQINSKAIVMNKAPPSYRKHILDHTNSPRGIPYFKTSLELPKTGPDLWFYGGKAPNKKKKKVKYLSPRSSCKNLCMKKAQTMKEVHD